MINIGIIGPGTFGQTQIKVFQGLNNVQVSAVAGKNSSNTAAVAKRYGIKKHTVNYLDLLQDPKINLVSIATPNHLHKEIFLEALKYDKHIILEKPAALNSKDIREMIVAAKGYNKLIAVDHPTRFNPVTQKLLELKQKGKLGEINFLQINAYTDYASSVDKAYSWYDSSQKGGGQILNMGTHLLDLVRFLLDMPKLESGTLHAKTVIEKYKDGKSPDIEQQFSANILWENKTDSTIFNTTTSFGYKNFEIRVLGSNGSAYYDDLDGLTVGNTDTGLVNYPVIDTLQSIHAGKSFVSKSFKYFADWLIKYLHQEVDSYHYCTLDEAAENLEILEEIKK